MSQWEPSASISNLKRRAEILSKIRAFFNQREVIEVETPSISSYPAVDLHIESFQVPQTGLPPKFLITSPEYHMKRLLCAGMGSIYQICRAFRQDESGERHNPEFTILEWYRLGWDYKQLMTDVTDLVTEVLGCGRAESIPYRDLFGKFLGLDPETANQNDFMGACSTYKLFPPDSLIQNQSSRDDWLDFFMSVFIEPQLGLKTPTLVYDYPSSQASLALINPGEPSTAERFELFVKGVELANGYSELKDPVEQHHRFVQINNQRKTRGLKKLNQDQRLIHALERGLPDCAGVALGVDRLIMLALEAKRIDEIVAFGWGRS